MVYESFSSRDTKRFAEALARRVVKRASQSANRKGAMVLALVGELGSGKTTFVQGFFRGLGIRRRVVSPTFILIRRLAVRHKLFANAYHVDAYRIKNPTELLRLGFKEILSDHENVVLIEWADRIKRILPKGARWISFSHSTRESERIIRM